MASLDHTVINVSVSIRKPFLWAIRFVVASAKISLLLSHPMDIETHQNIFDNVERISRKILSHPWAIKIS